MAQSPKVFMGNVESLFLLFLIQKWELKRFFSLKNARFSPELKKTLGD